MKVANYTVCSLNCVIQTFSYQCSTRNIGKYQYTSVRGSLRGGYIT